MSESESDALPLGDAPIYTFLDDPHIIAEKNGFVNRFLKKSWKILKNVLKGWSRNCPKSAKGKKRELYLIFDGEESDYSRDLFF